MKDTFRVLVLKNKLASSVVIKDDIKKWIGYEGEFTNLDLQVDVVETDIQNLTHKPFSSVETGVDEKGDPIIKVMYGLDNIKARVRELNVVPKYLYHAVFFLYDLDSTPISKEPTKSVGHWTYRNPIYQGTDFVEVATTALWDTVGDIFRVCTHEVRHVYVNRVRRAGILMLDVMDKTPKLINCSTHEIDPKGKCSRMFPYYKEYDVYALDGNRASENVLLSPYWLTISKQKVLTNYIQSLIDIVKRLKIKISETKSKDELVLLWAKAIQQHEGYYVGSRSYRNNNPANMRYTSYTASLGAIGDDGDNFSVFKTYKQGFNALVQFLTDAQNGKLTPYRGNPTLLDFFKVYAPDSDNNNPLQYAKSVADYIKNGITINTRINKISGSEFIQLRYPTQFGENSADVMQLQRGLIQLGYKIPAGATGFYGKETADAVLKFQITNLKQISELDSKWNINNIQSLMGKYFGKLSVRVINDML